MFHVELRQFPYQARAFNLSRRELEERILWPWLQGAAIELQERRFSPERARLAIYAGPELASSEIGLGRGWANVTKTGAEVTGQLLREASGRTRGSDDLLAALAAAAGGKTALTLAQAVALAAEVGTPAPPEQAIWELLREGRLVLALPGP